MEILKDLLNNIVNDTMSSLVEQERNLNTLLARDSEKMPTWRLDRLKERRVEVTAQMKLLKKIGSAIIEHFKEGRKK